WRWLSLCGGASAKGSRRRANGGPPRECPRHPACSSAASTRDRRVHLCERSLLASIITPDFGDRFLIGEREPTRTRGPRPIGSGKGSRHRPRTPRTRLKSSSAARGKRIGRSRFFGDPAPQGGTTPAAGTRPPQHNRRGNKDGGVSTDNYANNDCQREIPQHRAAKEKQAKNRDKRHGTCKNGSAQRLVDARIHDFLDTPTPPAGQAFPDPIVNDDRIVNGITGDGQHSANHCESKFAPEKREHTNGHEH